MSNVEEMQAEFKPEARADSPACVQSGAYLLELSADWIVLRASENAHRLLGKSHVTLIQEPLGSFVHSGALHDLRNLFSRLSGTSGIGRAYRVRLTDDPDLFDIAFQQIEDRVILEAVPSLAGGLGETLSAVSRLAEGLSRESGAALLDAAARRMRALTAFDRVTLLVGDRKAASSRTGVPFHSGANATLSDDFPLLVPDGAGADVPVFPRSESHSALGIALLRAPSAGQKGELAARGFASTMRVPVLLDGSAIGEFRFAHTTPRRPNFELHAAAELFAQIFALRLEIDRLKNG